MVHPDAIRVPNVTPYLSMAFKVEDSKATNVANPIDMNGEFSEKVDDFLTRIWKREPQNEGCGQHTKNFFQKYHDFQVIEGTKLSLYLFKSDYTS
jgi:hypothetical protein